MKYSYLNGVRAHANKYTAGRGFKKAIDFDRLSLIIAAALFVALLAYAFVIRQSIRFPSPVSANQGNSQGKGAQEDSANKDDPNNSTGTPSGQGGDAGATAGSAQPGSGAGGAQSSPTGGSGTGSILGSSGTGEQIIGGRGGGTAPTSSTGTTTTATPTAPSTTVTAPTVEEPSCLCETVNGAINDAQDALPSLTVPLLSAFSMQFGLFRHPKHRLRR